MSAPEPVLLEASDRLVDDYLSAFETARQRGPVDELPNFLPPKSHPQYLEVLCELLRVDLELGWSQGQCPRLQDYRPQFPELFADKPRLSQVAFEEYRMRRQAALPVLAAEYAERFQIDVRPWPDLHATALHVGSPEGNSAVSLLGATFPHAFPEIGTTIAGFELVLELGQGAFGRVYLAKQSELADRLVAVKVSTRLFHEPQLLAKLQHTNIVPVYSVHRHGPFQLVCMPFFGATTLKDLLTDLRGLDHLPMTGSQLVETLRRRHSQTVGDSSSGLTSWRAHPATDLPEPAPNYEQPAVSQVCLSEFLSRLSEATHVSAMTNLAAKLASGLAHAHERGIIHRDLKPANVLVADDGQPMLLDFNLSHEQSPQAGPKIEGGTLPYMAPEQLQSLLGESVLVDHRADLFALGVLLYELLTAHRPYPLHQGHSVNTQQLMLRDRQVLPTSPRRLNHRVGPALSGIVLKCLAPRAEDRYQAAADLVEDLERELEHLPLVHAGNPSLVERTRKWWTRHPRLGLALVAGPAAACLITAALWNWQQERSSKEVLQAQEALRQTTHDLFEAQFLLSHPAPSPAMIAEGQARLDQIFETRYGDVTNDAWQKSHLVTRLTTVEQSQLHRALAEAVLLAGEPIFRDTTPDTVAIHQALARNHACLAWLPADSDLRELLVTERSALSAALPETATARAQARRQMLAAPQNNLRPASRAAFYEALRQMSQAKNVQQAEALLSQMTHQSPQDATGWALLGHLYLYLDRPERAVGCYSACIVLWPDAAWAYLNRGIANRMAKDRAGALADFDMALQLRPGWSEAQFNRALVHLELNDAQAACQDLDQVLADSAAPTRAYFVRARARQLLNDETGAWADYQQGLSAIPADDESWVARGVAKLAEDPAGALSDFEAALQLNPGCRAAMQNSAHVLSERLGKPEAAIAMLDQVVAANPQYVSGLAGRGVLLARLGHRDRAVADAEAALRLDQSETNLYQVSCIYALTSKQHPADRATALQLLGQALRSGYGLDLLPQDADWDALRQDADVVKLVAAAEQLRQPPQPASP